MNQTGQRIGISPVIYPILKRKEWIEMISIEDDKQALLWFYDRYSRICKGRSSKHKAVDSQVSQMIVGIDKYITRYENSVQGAKKTASIANLNQLYKFYSRVHMCHPYILDKKLNRALNQLLDCLTSDGAKRLSAARSTIIDGDTIPLYELLSDEKDVKAAMSSDPIASIIPILEKRASMNSLSAMSSSQLIVCVTKAGKLYHRTSCPYCKHHNIKILSLEDAKVDGYVPCRCIGNAVGRTKTSAIPAVSDGRILSASVTAFIDESSIPNPWLWMDENLSKMQGSYSYIICEGCLSSENEISSMNTITSNACPSRWASSTVASSIEAIVTVLEILAFQYEYHGHVNIYTDNEPIVGQWMDNPFSSSLSKLFKCVSVEYTPRELNRRADALLKQHTFSDLPKDSMQRIKKASRDYLKTCEELEYVHAFFDNPRYDLPKLVYSLEKLASIAGYNPYNSSPDMEPADRLRMLLSMISIGLTRMTSLEEPSI